jgi:hypothetical protein
MIWWDGLGNPDELYYTERLLAWLDLGCGPGRLLLPLAEGLSPRVEDAFADTHISVGRFILAAATKA